MLRATSTTSRSAARRSSTATRRPSSPRRPRQQRTRLAELDERLRAAREAFAAVRTSRPPRRRRRWEASARRGRAGRTGRCATASWRISRSTAISRESASGEPMGATLEDGQPHFGDGRTGSAASFDGQRFIDAGDGPNLGFDDSFTLAAWIRPGRTRRRDRCRAPTKAIRAEVGLAAVTSRTGQGRGSTCQRAGSTTACAAETEDAVRAERVAPRGRHLRRLAGSPRGVASTSTGGPQALKPLLDDLEPDLPQRSPLRIGAGGASRTRFRGEIDDVRVYAARAHAERGRRRGDRRLGQPDRARSAAQARTPRRPTSAALLPGAARARRTFSRHGAASSSSPAAGRSSWKSFPTVMVMEEMPTPRDDVPADARRVRQAGREGDAGRARRCCRRCRTARRTTGSGFARWLVDPGNPLTARVAVNRFWQMFFGTGLVKTAEDFGTQGEWPSHPGAARLAGGRVRRRRAGTSRRCSKTDRHERHLPAVVEGHAGAARASDPENRLLARGPRFRLPAEMIRDQALAVGGPARREGRRAVGEAVPAGGLVGGAGRARAGRTSRTRATTSTAAACTRSGSARAAPPAMATFDAAGARGLHRAADRARTRRCRRWR